MVQTNLVGQIILGYTVTETINSGAYGTVYKVEKVNPSGRYVRALKHITIPSEKQYSSVLNSMGGDVSKADNYFSEMLNDIVSEIQILNVLSEKGAEHIVRYYENDIAMTEFPKKYDVYILMEYLTPLEDYIMENEFTVRDVLKLAFDVLEGLKVCHANGVWHRDIKDENIFVSNSGDYKIGDFGVSKVLKDSSKAESLKGTPNFLAPEVYLGKSGYTENVDLYSLGIVLYRLLNYGRNPFLPKFPKQYFSQDEDVAFEKRMTGTAPEMPLLGGEKVGAVIIKSIANSEERYQTAEDFLHALENAVQDMDREVLMQSVKMKIVPVMSDKTDPKQEIYRETLGEPTGSIQNGASDIESAKSPSINKHLFDSIGESPVITSVPSINLNTFLNNDKRNRYEEEKRQQQDNESQSLHQRVVERAPVMDEPETPEAIDRNVMSKVIYAVPIVLILIALIAYFIVIPNIYGQVVSFIDWLAADPQNIIDTIRNPNAAFFKTNYIILIRVFWYIWLAMFVTSLFFVGKQFQKKPEPNATNAILVKREAYLLVQDITEALKLEYQKNKNKDINTLLISVRQLEEKLSVESDFGYGKYNVINCENNIARQLQYLLDSVPYVSTGNISENASEMKKAILNINSLLRKRIELKKK